MKKILPILPVFLLFLGTAMAQCVVDTACVAPAEFHCPDDLPTAIAEQPYDETMTFVIPKSYFLGDDIPLAIPIDSVGVIDIQNMPSSFSYSMYPANQYIKGGESGCVNVTGNPTQDDIDTVVMTMVFRIYSVIFTNLGGYMDTTFDASIIIYDSSYHSVAEHDRTRLSAVYNQPNPFNGETKIAFHSSRIADVELSVYNTIGKKVYTSHITTVTGLNTIPFSGTHLPEGTYFYTLSDGLNQITRKMLIVK